MQLEAKKEDRELGHLCDTIRTLLSAKEYYKCEQIITEAMKKFPDAAQPHNLLGLLLEQRGNHASAMKHFRAALALEPAYRPARQNLQHYGTFYSCGACAFDESDCVDKYDDAGSTRESRGVGLEMLRPGSETA